MIGADGMKLAHSPDGQWDQTEKQHQVSSAPQHPRGRNGNGKGDETGPVLPGMAPWKGSLHTPLKNDPPGELCT